jgi:hypothetical protein
MSRTIKGGKGSGYEYWSARPFNKNGGCLGAFTKKRTHKAERVQGKKECKDDS